MADTREPGLGGLHEAFIRDGWAEFSRATQELTIYADYAVSPEHASITMSPDSIKDWLRRFGETLEATTRKRTDLIMAATEMPSDVRLGSFPPSLQIRDKMVDRLGTSEGGLAWALDSVVLRLAEIHEALRQSLAAHLRTDLENMKIIDRIRDALA